LKRRTALLPSSASMTSSPRSKKPFDKIKDDVASRWMADRRVKALSDKSARVVVRLREGEDFSKIAAEFHQPVQSTA